MNMMQEEEKIIVRAGGSIFELYEGWSRQICGAGRSFTARPGGM